jgi:hypothetical protein
MTLSVPLPSIAIASPTSMAPTAPNVATPSVAPSVPQIDTQTNEPIMKTSPWAKLISSMMP